MPDEAPTPLQQTIAVTAEQVGERLDRAVTATLSTLSRGYVQRLIDGGQITVNSSVVKAGHRLRAGDTIHVTIPPPVTTELKPEALPLSIVYEDNDLLVIDKPAGLVVHPAPGHPSGTLVNAVLAHAPAVAMNGTLRPGIVHRLDKDTSGLLVVAKTDAARAALVAQFASRSVLKEYLALVQGYPPDQLTIEAPIGRDPASRQRMAVVSTGRPALTEVTTLERLAGYSLVRARLHTGRTHQIRVHLAFRGYPIVGDATYGGASRLERRADGHSAPQRRPLHRQFLHATRLGLHLPSSGTWREFISPLPVELEAVLTWLRASGDDGPHPLPPLPKSGEGS